MQHPPKCPKCRRLQADRDGEYPVWCKLCGRFQRAYQPAFAQFEKAVHSHAACVECGQGALCRDLEPVPSAAGCASDAHVHARDDAEACGRFDPRALRRH